MYSVHTWKDLCGLFFLWKNFFSKPKSFLEWDPNWFQLPKHFNNSTIKTCIFHMKEIFLEVEILVEQKTSATSTFLTDKLYFISCLSIFYGPTYSIILSPLKIKLNKHCKSVSITSCLTTPFQLNKKSFTSKLT